MQYVFRIAWLLSLNMVILKFTHVVDCNNSSFIFIVEQYPLCVSIYITFSLYLLFLMHIWAISSLETAHFHSKLKKINVLFSTICVEVFPWMYAFFLGKYLRMERLDHNKAVCLTFQKLSKTLFQRDCTILNPHEE